MKIATTDLAFLKSDEERSQPNDFELQDDLEIESLRSELEKEKDQRLRLAAEFDNYRRRVRGEQTAAADAGKRELLEQLVSIVDDLELSLANLGESPDAVSHALRMTYRRFLGVLKSHGVMPFDSKGELFDPHRHEAFDVARDGATSTGTVQTELRRGYLWNDKLFRPALVIVAL